MITNYFSNISLLTPEHYKTTKKLSSDFIVETNNYLNENHAIFYVDSILDKIGRGNKIIGRIDVMIDALKDNSLKLEEWMQRRQEAGDAVNRMYNIYA